MPKPPPFRRHSISLHSAETPSWCWVPAGSLDVGDLWADHGRIRAISGETSEAHEVLVWAGEHGAPFVVNKEEMVWAFHRVSG